MTRRDSRHQFPASKTSIEIGVTSACPPELGNVSAAGLAFFVGKDAGIQVGAEFQGVIVNLAACQIRGDLIVRNVSATDGPRVVCGCLFYPATPAETERWMVVVNTIDAAVGS